jgi:hypothetical protein
MSQSQAVSLVNTPIYDYYIWALLKNLGFFFFFLLNFKISKLEYVAYIKAYTEPHFIIETISFRTLAAASL